MTKISFKIRRRSPLNVRDSDKKEAKSRSRSISREKNGHSHSKKKFSSNFDDDNKHDLEKPMKSQTIEIEKRSTSPLLRKEEKNDHKSERKRKKSSKRSSSKKLKLTGSRSPSKKSESKDKTKSSHLSKRYKDKSSSNRISDDKILDKRKHGTNDERHAKKNLDEILEVSRKLEENDSYKISELSNIKESRNKNKEKIIPTKDQAYIVRRAMRNISKALTSLPPDSEQILKNSLNFEEKAKSVIALGSKKDVSKISVKRNSSPRQSQNYHSPSKNILKPQIYDLLDDVDVEECKFHSCALAQIDWKSLFENQPIVSLSNKELDKNAPNTYISRILNPLRPQMDPKWKDINWDEHLDTFTPPSDLKILKEALNNFKQTTILD